MNSSSKINFVPTVNQMEGVYFDTGSYAMCLAVGNGLCNRGIYDQRNFSWIVYKDASDTWLNSEGVTGSHKNFVINHPEGSWVSGLRINSVANNANGSAHITLGGQSGTTSGSSSSYPMYQIGKMSDLSGNFSIRAVYNGTYQDVFEANSQNTKIRSYGNPTNEYIDIGIGTVDLHAISNDTSGGRIRAFTSQIQLTGNGTGNGNSGDPFVLSGFESDYVNTSSTIDTGVYLKSGGGELALVFLRSGDGNSFFAARLLRNNGGSLQSINLASNGTSHATITLNGSTIRIQNTNSSYRLYYKILRMF